ncbi:hypothetical protein K1719_033590 [Acacia pycnantha]|nr:hypothetical protein K1719_033590 [Acacia pycnantha]
MTGASVSRSFSTAGTFHKVVPINKSLSMQFYLTTSGANHHVTADSSSLDSVKSVGHENRGLTDEKQSKTRVVSNE